MKLVPEFPRKRPVELSDKALFDTLFKKYPASISEFTFTNIFAWRSAYQFCVARMDDLFLLVSSKDRYPDLFDPIGPAEKKKDVIEKCMSLYGEDKRIKFVRLPQETAALFKDSSRFEIEEDRDNFDYVYSTEDLIHLRGKDFDGKRNFIKRFKESYGFSYKRATKDNIDACLSFEEEWCLAKDCQRTEGLKKEKEAVTEILENFQFLGVKGGMIEIGGKIEAVSLGEALNHETFVVHVEKANGRFIGIYQAINQMLCSHEAAKFKYVNREQDLGVLGLRKAKESYHPRMMVKKYTLSFR